MIDVHTPAGLRRLVGALCLTGAPVVGTASALVNPKFGGDLSAEVAFVASQPTQWAVGIFLMLLSFLLFIPAFAAVARLIEGRWLLVGYLGAGLATVGAFFHGAILGFALFEVPLAQSSLDRDQVVSLVSQSGDAPAFVMLLVPFIGFYIGSVLLAVAAWRAHVATIWIAALIIVGLAAEFVAPAAISNYVMYLTALVAYSALAYRTLRMPGQMPSPRPSSAPATPPSHTAHASLA